MATFRVGQRVRVRKDANPEVGLEKYRGCETTIVRAAGSLEAFVFGAQWILDLPPVGGATCVGARESALEPLIDPGADAFVERIKKLRPYDEPKVERERIAQGTAKP